MTETELSNVKEQLTAELDGMRRLQDISTRLVPHGDFHPLLEEILDCAIVLTNADMGNIQLLDKDSGALGMVVQRGFERDFELFDHMHDGLAACGTAFRDGQRVIIEDVLTDPILKGTPSCDVMLKAGVSAAQTTPLATRAGEVIGMLSMHYRAPHRPDER